jgi:hypothetical protein
MAFDEKQLTEAAESALQGAEDRQQHRDLVGKLRLAKTMMILTIIFFTAFLILIIAKLALHKEVASLWVFGLLMTVSAITWIGNYRAAKRALAV